jgi:peptidyl-prolyl cis-trans isomerase A (cyclophilin A)
MRTTALVLLVVAAAVGCKKKEAASASPNTATTTASAARPDFHKPADPGFTAQAPDSFRARFTTTKGDFVIEVHRAWAPLGADRFYNLVRSGFYDGVRFFRVIPGFMAQFGIHGDTAVVSAWRESVFPDDPVRRTNGPGMVTFATAGPGTRTTQVFINFVDNGRLDGMGFAPFGRVAAGVDVISNLYGGYGEGAPRGRGPDQMRLNIEGEKYLARQFPKLDKIIKAVVE